MRGEGGVARSQPMSTAVHRSPNKLRRSNSPYLTYAVHTRSRTRKSCREIEPGLPLQLRPIIFNAPLIALLFIYLFFILVMTSWYYICISQSDSRCPWALILATNDRAVTLTTNLFTVSKNIVLKLESHKKT